jgi:hypothetical protein
MAKKEDSIIEMYKEENQALNKTVGDLNQDKYDLKVECDIWRLRWDALKRYLIETENSDYMDKDYRDSASALLKKMEGIESRWN